MPIIHQEPKANVSVRVSMRVWEALTSAAERERRTASSIAALWLERYIAEHESPEKKPVDR